MTIDILYNFNYTFNLAFIYLVKYFKQNINFVKETILENKFNIFIFVLNIVPISFFDEAIYFYREFIIYLYWFILGVLSTIGIGFGLQTGVLFVVPFVIDNYNIICLKKKCNFFDISTVFLTCLPYVISWGVGSAFGELPPFFLAKNSQLDSFESDYTYLNKITHCVKKCIKKNSFITILVFSCWPSITFDMCGLMCGYYNLTLFQFLVPTIIGKAFIKTPVLLYLILYFYNKHKTLIENENTKTILSYIPLVIILFFIKSFIEVCAKKQLEIEKKK